jgi:hypothetical protein
MPDEKNNRQTIATVSALVLGVAGALGWIKPPDTTAAAKGYDVTRAAVEALDAKHNQGLEDLEERQEVFERWVAKRLAEIDRDHMPGDDEPVDPDVDEPQHAPPPRPERKSAASKPLPAAAELFE